MTDRPILFSAPMIRALLAGRKTQTRRIINPQPVVHPAGNWSWEGRGGGFVGAAGTHLDEGFPDAACAWMRNHPGDRLWVRENVQAVIDDEEYDAIKYLADGLVVRSTAETSDEAQRYADQLYGYRRRKGAPDRMSGVPVPSIHMPRWASRLTLTVTEVRVQRLQACSEEDAIAEGVVRDTVGGCRELFADPAAMADYPDDTPLFFVPGDDSEDALRFSAVDAYRRLWTEINGFGSWEVNPWVVAYTSTVERRNIDAARAA